MVCNKCKKHISDKLIICPYCGSPVKKNKRVGNVVKNKYVKQDNSLAVGGVTSTSGTSFVKLQKIKKAPNIERKNYVNYLDYKDAKDKIRDEHLAQVNNYKVDDYKKQIALDNANGKTTGAKHGKTKFSPKSAVAGLKLKREKDLNNVGNVIKTYNYNSDLKRNSNYNGAYHPQSGKFITLVNYQKKNKNSKTKKKIGGLKAFDIVAYLVVIVIWVAVFVTIVKNNDYYFAGSNDKTNKDNNLVGYESVAKSNQEIKKTNIGWTAIVYDNQYLKQASIKSINEVKQLIVNDSVNQKENCPKEIMQIENDIINKYEIIAVNFCEMDESLALELEKVIGYIYDNFPKARNYLTNVTLANVGDNNSYIAAFMPMFVFATSNSNSGFPWAIKTQVILNAKYFLNEDMLENSISRGAASGYFPPNATKGSAVAHEFGHYLSYIALLNYYQSDKLNYVTYDDYGNLMSVLNDFEKGNFSYQLLQEAYGRFQSIYQSDETFTEFRSNISRYAMAMDNNGEYIYDETIAEAFHDVYLNKDKAKNESKVIVEVLVDKL